MAELGSLYVVFVVFLLVASVLWILLPFAVFGIKPRLDKIHWQLERMNEYMKSANEQNRVLVEQNKLLLRPSLPPVPRLS